jgi:hypothetical protein
MAGFKEKQQPALAKTHTASPSITIPPFLKMKFNWNAKKPEYHYPGFPVSHCS